MKKNHFSWVVVLAAGVFASCNSSDTSSTTTSSSDSASNMSDNTANMETASSMSGTGTNTTSTANMAPLSSADRTFVMKAAMGGMMEVQAANIALKNSSNDRIKGFASMMVRDHTNANNELKSFASSRGLTIPEDSLMAKNKAHLDAMEKMQGKAFDKHYMDMMVNDHKKTVTDFQTEAKSGNDADLKAWADKTLPTLKVHADSAMAISKMKM